MHTRVSFTNNVSTQIQTWIQIYLDFIFSAEIKIKHQSYCEVTQK